jgi:hypothetical protein
LFEVNLTISRCSRVDDDGAGARVESELLGTWKRRFLERVFFGT